MSYGGYSSPYAPSMSHRGSSYSSYGGGLPDPTPVSQYTTEPAQANRRKVPFALVGLVIVLVSAFGFYYAENEAVRMSLALEQGFRSCVTLNSEVLGKYRPNTLVYATGQLSAQQSIFDEEFQLRLPVAKLWRYAEALEWVEEPTDPPQYKLSWVVEHVDSRGFKDQTYRNDPMIVRSKMFDAKNVHIGVYGLDLKLFGSLSLSECPQVDLARVSHVAPKKLQLVDNAYHSGDPNHPKAGDVRVSFFYLGVTAPDSSVGEQSHVSVIGGMKNETISFHRTSTGATIGLAIPGGDTKEGLFARAQPGDGGMSMLVRLGSMSFMWLGLWAMRGIIQTGIFSRIPLLNRMASRASPVFALWLALQASLIIMAIIWIGSHFLYGVGLAVLAFIVFVLGLRAKGGEKKRE
eukprot:m.73171 g.73171  ORF g.73171 m.73171 type:complete len:405 (-) comp7708_c1_seq1:2569-3783(-)